MPDKKTLVDYMRELQELHDPARAELRQHPFCGLEGLNGWPSSKPPEAEAFTGCIAYWVTDPDHIGAALYKRAEVDFQNGMMHGCARFYSPKGAPEIFLYVSEGVVLYARRYRQDPHCHVLLPFRSVVAGYWGLREPGWFPGELRRQCGRRDDHGTHYDR